MDAMMTPHQAIRVSFLVALSAVSIAACNHKSNPHIRKNMQQLPTRLHPLFEKTKPVCFGRFVMDIPSTAIMTYGPAEAGVPIEYFPGEAATVAKRVAEHLVEVEAERRYLDEEDAAKMDMFGKVTNGHLDGQKLVFGSKSHVFYSIYSFVPLGDDLYVHYVNTVEPVASETNRLIDILNLTAQNLRSRADDEVPPEEGMCIEGGFIPLKYERERATVGIRLAEFPDVHFSVEVHKNLDYIDEKADLELRYKEGEQEAKRRGFGPIYARIDWLRRTRRQLGHWNGYEVLGRRPAFKHEKSVHEFEFHSLGVRNDPLHPSLNVQLSTGVKNNQNSSVEPSITNEEAVALWDKLIGSIRVRQPSDATPQPDSKTKQNVPLGHIAPSGSACIQSGTWQCAESGAVERDQYRAFNAGDVLPEAAFRTSASVWQRLWGEKPIRKLATTWRLVSYESKNSEAGPLPRTPT
jgi:hypothetical protein